MASPRTTTSQSEHAVLLEGCGLLDRSERGKLALTGSGAVEFLNGQITNELAGLRPGEGCYAAFLTHKGKMLGDLRVLAVGDDGDTDPGELLLDTERVALQGLFDMIRRFKVGYDVALHKRTLECALVSLIGPEAVAVAGVRDGLPDVEHAHVACEIGGVPARAVRTDLGVDVLFDSASLEVVTSALRSHGAVDVSEEAVECVRIEHGRPRYGIELDDTVIPQEAGLNERAVSFTKGCYVGQETVARLFYKGKPNRHLRGLVLSEPVSGEAALTLGDRAVGHLAGSVVSPTLGPIALALLRREAEPGAALAVGERGVSARVVELPFSDSV
jgi:folate-binding protein YgfZ